MSEGEEGGDDDEGEEERATRKKVAERRDEDEPAGTRRRESVSGSASRAPALGAHRLDASNFDAPDEIAALQERRDARDLLVVDLELAGELDEDGLNDVEIGDRDRRAERHEPVEGPREDPVLTGHAASRDGEEAKVAGASRSRAGAELCGFADDRIVC